MEEQLEGLVDLGLGLLGRVPSLGKQVAVMPGLEGSVAVMLQSPVSVPIVNAIEFPSSDTVPR